MAQNLIDLRRRIKSVRNTQKTTKAMKTVSAVKLRRSVTEINRNRPILEKIGGILRRVSEASHEKCHPFLEKREEGRTLIVLISADKGMCGAFNSHLFSKLGSYYNQLRETEEDAPLLVTVGNKAFKHLSKGEHLIPIRKSYQSIMGRLKYENAADLSRYLQDIYLKSVHEIKKIEFMYTEFISAAKTEITIKPLFPIETEWEKEKKDEKNRDIEYIFEPSPEEIFKALLPRYIDAWVYQTLLQSSASEHAARMIAMDLASKNASEMIRSLSLTMNKMRQASITKELLEIITATEALKK